MKRYLLLVVITLIVVSLSSCGLLSLVGIGGKTSTLAFENTEVVSRSIVTTRSLDPSLQVLNEAYQDFGSRVGSYTPTEFKLFIQEIVLYKSNDAIYSIELDRPLSADSVEHPEYHQANFIDDIVLSPESGIPPADYDGMFFFFFTNRASMMGVDGTEENPDYWVQTETVISVEVPGYENVWQDEPSEIEEINSFQNNADGSLSFDLNYINPGKYLMVPGTGTGGFQSIGMFFYMRGAVPHAILPGLEGHPDIWDTSDPDTGALKNNGATGNSSAVFLPFDGIDIPSSAQSVSFTVAWDLEGIIEVYDNNTPLDKSDDILVIANNFWDRFSLIPEVVE